MIFSPIFKYEISFCFIDEDVLHQISQASCILMHCVAFFIDDKSTTEVHLKF